MRIPAFFKAAVLPLAALIAFASCDKKDKNDPPTDTTVQLRSFDPKVGAEGAAIKLVGQHFSTTLSNNTVTFNGKAATVTSVNTTGTELMVTVPEDATSGKIMITVGGKSVTSTEDFTVNPSAPTIASFSPEKGDVATVVTLTGTNFKAGGTKVFFGTVEVPAADVSVASRTSLTAKVPTGATTSSIKVVTGPSLEAISATPFYVKPTLAAFSPAIAPEGAIVTLTGTSFSTDAAVPNVVKFGSVVVPAADVQVVSATELKVKVPAGLPTDEVKISVSVKDQLVESATNFTILPTLTSYTPDHGERASVVTLNGKNMALDAEVWIGSVQITSFEAGRTTSQIQFKVPATAVEGKITLKQGGTTYEFGNYTVTNIWKDLNTAENGMQIYTNSLSFTYNGKLYVGTGYGYKNGGVYYFRYFSIYDPQTNSWSKTPDFPTAFGDRDFAMATVKGNKLYIGGGFRQQQSPNIYYSDLWEVDLGNNTWTRMVDLPAQVNSGCAYTLTNSGSERIYMGRGLVGNTWNAYMWELDPSQTTGSQKGAWIKNIWSMDGITTQIAAQFTINNLGYYTVGNGETYSFNPTATNSITKLAKSPMANLTFAERGGFTFNGKGYIVYDWDGILAEYDPATNTWKQYNIQKQLGIYFVTVVNNRIYGSTGTGKVYEFIPNY